MFLSFVYHSNIWAITQNMLASKISVLHSWWKSMVLCHNIIWGNRLVKTSVFSVSNHQYLPLYQMTEKLKYPSVWFHQKIVFQISKALSISLKAFCMLVTSCCSLLYAYFGAQRLLIGSRLWFSDTQHFTCILLAFFLFFSFLLAFFIKQHFFVCLFCFFKSGILNFHRGFKFHTKKWF